MTRRTDVRGGEAPTVGTDVWERACQAKAPDERHHVPGVALVFEGGGMRASYTCAIAQTLLEHGLDFDFVCGISAGSSNTVNYVSRDIWRTRVSFTDFVLDPRFGGMKHLFQYLAGHVAADAHDGNAAGARGCGDGGDGV